MRFRDARRTGRERRGLRARSRVRVCRIGVRRCSAELVRFGNNATERVPNR